MSRIFRLAVISSSRAYLIEFYLENSTKACTFLFVREKTLCPLWQKIVLWQSHDCIWPEIRNTDQCKPRREILSMQPEQVSSITATQRPCKVGWFYSSVPYTKAICRVKCGSNLWARIISVSFPGKLESHWSGVYSSLREVLAARESGKLVI